MLECIYFYSKSKERK